jgi:glycosyltransferase involved in cell wall biosynthesis
MHLFDIKRFSEVIYERFSGESAEVVVIIPIYNNAHFVKECLESVVRQDLTPLSLCVVDDCSADNGLEATLQFIQEHMDRFATARLLRHRRNQGPSMARNSGVAWSDEPYVFMLDSDNRLRRPALTRLLEALRDSDANIAYSQLCFFGAITGPGTADIWAVDRVPETPYIDVMSLIERDALLEAGGFDLLADDIGWEDQDLWCRFAELGKSGVFLPEMLCDYRVHDTQRSKMVLAATDRLKAEIVVRHPRLFRGLDAK